MCKWLKIVHKVWALSLMYKVTVAEFAFYKKKKKKVGRAFEDNFFRGGGWVRIFKSLNAQEGDIKL